MIGLLLFIIAWLLVPILLIVNLHAVYQKNKTIKGYFLSTAVSVDIWAKMEFRTLWKTYVFQDDWKYLENYDWKFNRETLSSMLGKCEVDKKLKPKGKGMISSWFYGESLVKILNKIDKNHCFNSINLKEGNWIFPFCFTGILQYLE